MAQSLQLWFGKELKQRLWAGLFSKTISGYNRKMHKHKQELFAPLAHQATQLPSGIGLKVLEVGAGPGSNFKYFPSGSLVTCLDPNRYFEAYLSDNASGNVQLERFVVGFAEDMHELADNSFDAVVTSLVLCSVRDLPAAFAEIARVLKPGGRYYLIEHVAAKQGSSLLSWQTFVSNRFLWQYIGDGCRMDKNIAAMLRECGLFQHVDVTEFEAPFKGLLRLAAPHVRAVCTK